MFESFITNLYGAQTYLVLKWILYLYPLWLPFVLGPLFWLLWVRYIRYLNFFNRKHILLEIKLPADVTRSPLSMELFLNILHQTGGEATPIDVYWMGKTRAWFSLELVSLGGQIHFYIWTQEVFKSLIESQVYAQFPDVEIQQVEDYALQFNFKPGETDLWSSNYIKEKPNPIPVKTYIDYGLDKIPDAENTSDPISGIIELFSTIKPNEQLWLQFVVRAHKKEKRAGFFSKASNWATDIEEMKQAFRDRIREHGGRAYGQEENKFFDALSRAEHKFPLDCGIRIVYAGQKEINGAFTIGLRSLFRPYSAAQLRDSSGFNNIKTKLSTDFDYPWQDYAKVFLNRKKRNQLDAYKRRMFFFPPHKELHCVVTTEELATMYHFPNASVAAPGLGRIQSKRAQAPTNLPV